MAQTVDIEARLREGLSLFAAGRHGRAYGAVLDAVEASPADPRLWHLLGTIALEADRPWQAYHAFTRRRRLQDDQDAVFSQLAAAYYAVDVPAARAHAEEAAARFPQNVEARRWAAKMAGIADERDLLVDVARTLCRQGRYADSLDLFVAALEIRDSPEVRLWLGRAFLALAQAADAVPLLESAAIELPDDPSICVDVAAAYAAGGRPDIARAWLEQGARVHPTSAKVRAAQARLALDQGDVETAGGAGERAAHLAPGDPDTWLTAARVREAFGDPQGARLAADRSVALDPGRAAGWNLAARLVEADGDPGLAAHYRAAAVRLAADVHPDTATPLPLRTEIDHLYARIVQTPKEVRAYRDRATVNGLLGLPQRALYFLDLTIRDIAGGPTPELLVERAGLLLRLGRTDEALALCEEVLRMDPQSDLARRGLEAVIQPADATRPLPTRPEPAGTIRFCRQCGQEIPATAAFCRRCGVRRT